MLNATEVRSYFPALKQKVHGRNLAYLDSAATTLKPQSVIDRITRFYTLETANVHRGAHFLSDAATGEFEKARETVRLFINAASVAHTPDLSKHALKISSIATSKRGAQTIADMC